MLGIILSVVLLWDDTGMKSVGNNFLCCPFVG